tara:strand:+ start:365 stop:517 length:153 start_codon:yes stop_codon:yes gene_type:complete
VHKQAVVLDMLTQAQVAQAEQQVLQALGAEVVVVMNTVVEVAQVAPQEQR